MINITSQSGKTTTYLKELIADTSADVLQLPTDIAPGSTAYCIETGIAYMLGGDKQWHEI